QRVRMDDRVGSRLDLFLRRLADRAIVVLRYGAEIDVHPEEVVALTRNVQDVATVVRLDGAFGANVREVGVGEYVHHAPGMFRVVAGELAPDRVPDATVRAVAADHVLGPHGAFGALVRP